MARVRMNAGAIFDAFPEGQTMTREAFISEVARLSDPHQMQADLTRMTMARDKQRTLGLFAKNKIDKAVGEKC